MRREAEFTEKGLGILAALADTVRFDPATGLMKDQYGLEGFGLDTFENMSLALAYYLAGHQAKAMRLLGSVLKHMPVDQSTGLIRNKVNGQNIFASDNLLRAILRLARLEDGSAGETVEKVESCIGFDARLRLLGNGIRRPELYAFNTCLLSIYYYLVGSTRRANVHRSAVVKHFGFDTSTGLLLGVSGRKEQTNSAAFTLDNALLAICCLLNGDVQRAVGIVSAVETHIGFAEVPKLFRRGLKAPADVVYTYVNTAMAIAYLSLAGQLKRLIQ